MCALQPCTHRTSPHSTQHNTAAEVASVTRTVIDRRRRVIAGRWQERTVRTGRAERGGQAEVRRELPGGVSHYDLSHGTQVRGTRVRTCEPPTSARQRFVWRFSGTRSGPPRDAAERSAVVRTALGRRGGVSATVAAARASARCGSSVSTHRRHGWPLVIDTRTAAPMRSGVSSAAGTAKPGTGITAAGMFRVRSQKRRCASPQLSRPTARACQRGANWESHRATGRLRRRSRGVHAGSHPGGASKDSFEWRRQGGYGGDAGVSRPPHLHAVLHDWAKTRRRF